MNSDYVQAWRLMAATICIVASIIAGCLGTENYHNNASAETINKQNNSTIVDLVGKGADPEEARCVVKGSRYETPCVVTGVEEAGGV